MPSSKFGSKFLGEERYQQYVNELTAEGTVGGEQLSPEERKEGFKKRNDKIGFQNFVDKVLEKKQSATVSKRPTALPGGGGGGALVKRPKAGISKFDPSKIASASAAGGGILEEILKIVTSIRDTLIEKNEFDVDQSKKDSQSAERAKRAKKENRLESGIFKGLAKATEKILAPVKGMFEKIFDFIKTVILGNIVMNIIKWMGDPENERKIKNLIRFFKDFWPAIVGAYLLFGTKFGALIRTIGGWAVQILRFAVPKLLRFVTRNPKAATALAVAGGVGMLGARILTGTEVGADEEEGEETPEQQQEAEFRAAQTTATDSLREAEAEPEVEPAKMSKGGRVPGSGNKDTVPAMLTPGEFVMSKGAVNKYGTNTLAAMNSMGGGTNIPSLMGGGVLGFSGGGSVSEKEEPGGRNKEGTSANERHAELMRTTDPKKIAEYDKQHGEGAYSKKLKEKLNKLYSGQAPEQTQSMSTGKVVGRENLSPKAQKALARLDAQKAGEQTPNMQYTKNGQKISADQFKKVKGMMSAVKEGGAKGALDHMVSGAKNMFGGMFSKVQGAIKDPKSFVESMGGTVKDGNIGTPTAQEQKDIDALAAKKEKLKQSQQKLMGLKSPAKPSQDDDALRAEYNKIQDDPHHPLFEKVRGGGDIDDFGMRFSEFKEFKNQQTQTKPQAQVEKATPPPSVAQSSNSSGGNTPKFDYKQSTKNLSAKTASVSKPSRPSSTAAYNQMQQGQQQSPQKAEKSQSPGIPSFDAAAMSSPKKIKTLGITV
ncbi:putative bacteriophage-related transmembrane protein [Synechococcus phage S-SM2]|uniref:Putative bacteriophage-related transmembrane protein n=1 Tax=Synechococcus phage S-SM2 TaxID=444860 RepID=E3SIQ8_9CAUD|nr:putative bacteriophage-related transmembrane protein [Synechococcus phage S-SM2]ADO97356.1 putative bacteriophage-related transmembrane protein [Synechococcus phage S-SM2]